ncbi:unnamed protein product [Rhizopus stolonifer]
MLIILMKIVDERQPILVSKQRIRGDPITYRKYLESIDSSLDQAQSNKRQRNELQTEAQVAQFINEVYRHDEPKNLEIYHKRSMSTVLPDTKKNCGIFILLILDFSSRSEHLKHLLSGAKIDNYHFKWERNQTRWNSFKNLYTMEDAYYDDLIESICNYLPNYQELLRNLIHNGYEIIGYARKSSTIDNIDTRTRLLQTMVDNLHERSFTSKVYVSTCSYSSTPFFERDLKNKDDIIDKLNQVTGNTQDMLIYLKSIKHNICSVSIDFAGLTTRTHDIIQLIENNPAIKKIAIETFTVANELFYLILIA